MANEQGSEGGKARRDKLTPQQRSEIARKGALAKWEKQDMPQAVCGTPEKPVRVGETTIRCYVLDD
ncbi:MAG TPA: hypothetical protein VEB22_09980, partial [Phycisphaerales bacterium]|nr:hypothetical protein [Phycisphaerales bacterium]